MKVGHICNLRNELTVFHLIVFIAHVDIGALLQAIREQLVQLMFETFNVSAFYASEQVVLSLYAVGRISGCTVDIGHGKIGIQLCQLVASA